MKKKLIFLGYCGKCGRDVETDYCYHCQQPTQPKEQVYFSKGKKMPKKITFNQAQKRADKAMSAYVRLVDECRLHWLAQSKHVILPFKCSAVLQCCHKIPKAFSSGLRYDLRNVFCGCSSSNKWEQMRRGSGEWEEIIQKIWAEDWDYLQERKRMKCKRSTADLLMIEKMFKDKLKGL